MPNQKNIKRITAKNRRKNSCPNSAFLHVMCLFLFALPKASTKLSTFVNCQRCSSSHSRSSESVLCMGKFRNSLEKIVNNTLDSGYKMEEISSCCCFLVDTQMTVMIHRHQILSFLTPQHLKLSKVL